jgi:uncharacterized protein (TIGR03000 family)
VSAASLLLLASPVQAQRGGHGGGHGGGHAGGHAGGFAVGGRGAAIGGFHGSTFHGGFAHNMNGFNHSHNVVRVNHPFFGFGRFYLPYYGWGGFYLPYYDYGDYWPYYAMPMSYGPFMGNLGLAAYANYAVPSDYGAAQSATERPAVDNAAHLQLVVPENAEIVIDGVKTTQIGATREFTSPALSPGTTYHYKITVRYSDAKGKVVEDTRDIRFRANDWYRIDFNRPPPPQALPAPAPEPKGKE